MAGALVTKTGGVMLIVPVVNKIIDAYSESKRLEFELARVREQGGIAHRALKLKARECECNYKIQVRKIESSEHTVSSMLDGLRLALEKSKCSREELLRSSEKVLKAIVCRTTPAEKIRVLMELYKDIQAQLRIMEENSLKTLHEGFEACDRVVAQIGSMANQRPVLGYEECSMAQIENKEV